MEKETRIGRWYFGGVAAAGAACCTHPLDLIKVHLQTQQTKVSTIVITSKVMNTEGVFGFYNGLSASVLRQLTYTTTRFAIYESVKNRISGDAPMPFYQKMLLAGFSGIIGGIVGNPSDLVNVRMQNDVKLPKSQRRNYRHAFDGLYRIVREEGVSNLMNGTIMSTSRAVLITIGQLSFYDQIKQTMLENHWAEDNIYTHFFCSFCSASIATVFTQPMDVMKTKMQNAKNGEYKGISDCFMQTAKRGPLGFFVGFGPAWVRLAPHTILVFIFFEQLRMNFGYVKD